MLRYNLSHECLDHHNTQPRTFYRSHHEAQRCPPTVSFCESKLGLRNTATYADRAHVCQNKEDNKSKPINSPGTPRHPTTTPAKTITPSQSSFEKDIAQWQSSISILYEQWAENHLSRYRTPLPSTLMSLALAKYVPDVEHRKSQRPVGVSGIGFRHLSTKGPVLYV
ncbi:hypothetical protein ASPFODRAFT_321086 [Aspergillus luchuensis CBS 106.47]|uniref:Uncharacterized protein n=1 Tax=Aspergillus luchuensis (strain CBS 106.47) TaxID=1137211 RepID=A0A1M3T9P7_ASPLC|nr:hypothetical protein ASPFODRAFT_321086 [Aspergillus luchuensis CBS 106.47]